MFGTAFRYAPNNDYHVNISLQANFSVKSLRVCFTDGCDDVLDYCDEFGSNNGGWDDNGVFKGGFCDDDIVVQNDKGDGDAVIFKFI